MDRRAFLKIPAGGVMAAAAASWLTPGQALASFFSDEAAVAKGPAASAARQALRRLGGMERFVRPGRRIVLKSSASFADFQRGAAPGNLELIQEILLMFQEAGGKAGDVLILDDSFYNLNLLPPRYNSISVCDGNHKHGACRDLPDVHEVIVLESAKMSRQARLGEAENMLTALPARKGGAPLVALQPMYHGGISLSLSIGYQEQNRRSGAVDLYSFNSDNRSLTIVDIGRDVRVKGPDGEERVFHPTHYCPATYSQLAGMTSLT
jgi:hypothetical protein